MNNLEIIEKFYHEIWNQGQKEVAYEILSPKLIFEGLQDLRKVELKISYLMLI